FGGGEIEAAAIIGDLENGGALVGRRPEANTNAGGVAVANGVAGAFADDLEGGGAGGEVEAIGDRVVDVEIARGRTGGVKKLEEAGDGGRKGAAVKRLGFEAGDEVAHVADRFVQGGSHLI